MTLLVSIESRSGTRTWKMASLPVGARIVYLTDGSESYYYSGCLLRQVFIKGQHFELTYERSRLTKIIKTYPINETLVSISWCNSGKLCSIETADSKTTLIYNNNAQLERCECASNALGTRAWEFYYLDGLLHNFGRDGLLTPYHWAAPARRLSVVTPIPLVPEVRNDGSYEYHSVPALGNILTVTFQGQLPEDNGRWEFNEETGDVRIHRSARHYQ